MTRMREAGRRLSRQGTTLLELIIAFFILVVAALSITGLMSYGHRGTEKDFRAVQAVQLLEDRMNRLLMLPAAQLLTSITAGGSTPQTFASALLGVPLGPVTIGANAFTVTATLNRQPVRFATRELDLLNAVNYNPSDPATWRFSDPSDAHGSFNGTTLPYRVVKIVVTVSWEELVNRKAPRSIEAVSFAVDFTS